MAKGRKRFRIAGRRRTKAKSTRLKTIEKRVSRIENGTERNYDSQYSAAVGVPGVPAVLTMSNNIGSVSQPPASTDLTNQIVSITPYIPQGAADTERTGDEVLMKRLEFNMVCTYQPTGDGKINVGDVASCRVLLMWDNDPTYSAPPTAQGLVASVTTNPLQWAQILNLGGRTGETTPLFSLDKFNNDLVIRDKRVSIIADFKFDLVAGTAKSVFRRTVIRNWVRQKLKFLASGANPINRKLKLAFVSNKPAQEAPELMYAQKVYFTDK